jgi:hypothetical protein
MKIRLFGDSLRIRLSQLEVEALAGGGAIESVTPFSDEAFACTVQPSETAFEARHAAGRITVMVPLERAQAWAASSEEGMYAEQPVQGLLLRISVEKDYRCIHKPDSPDNADTFPNPAAITGD